MSLFSNVSMKDYSGILDEHLVPRKKWDHFLEKGTVRCHLQQSEPQPLEIMHDHSIQGS
mgnify:CR=1 FL=1